MKRFLAVLVVVAFVVAVPLSHLVTATPPDLKNLVDICHFPDGLPVGVVISVDVNAVAVFEKLHGDCTNFTIVEKDGSCICSSP
jgi:hypothetical protein